MADQFAMEPGLGNYPSLLGEVASQLNDLAAELGASGDCAIKQGDCDNLWELWNQSRESVQDKAPWMNSLADDWSGLGSDFQASDGG